jgi:hypothetical protein
MSTVFQAISIVGGVVPPSLLGRIQSGEVNDPKSLDPASYHLMGTETVRDASSRSWGYLRSAWQSWRELDAKKRPDGQGAGTGDARQKWLLILLREFGYGQVPATGGGLQAADTTYPISHRWESVPIHLLGPGVELDKRSVGVEGAAKRAPQAMVQEFLNREGDYLWAILSNGLKLRLLRDSTALAGSAYIEFDLETIFDSDLYPEFQILWQLCHQSRLDKRGGAEGSPADCWLESWRAESVDAGARALDKLGVGVEKALDYLGTGFLRHPENGWLVDALHAGELSPRDFHKALLRTAYRLLFCFVVEDRNALLAPEAPAVSRERYAKYFSTQRLRKLSRNRDGGPHPDLWRTQKLVLSALGGNGLEAVGLPALGGLFDPDSRAKTLEHQPHEDLLMGAELANQDFLKAIRRLSWVVGKGERLQPVDYRHLGAEELGSVYESLLELIPRIDTEARSFELVRLAGNERKVTGSYYTPPSLVSALLDTALDPLLDDAVNGGKDAADRESRLLGLTVCDPASGSGGFLVAAARRIARRLAEVRAGENEPTPAEIQHALHDVVERCIYGVDMNDLAAELAKVSLWLEAMEPGKPLGFLDGRIKIGNSLLGTTPALLAGGVPDEAFGVLEGDDKKYAAEVKKRNRAENTKSKTGGRFVHGGQEAFTLGQPTTGMVELIGRRQELMKPVSTAAEARSRAKAYAAFDRSADMEQQRLHADAWCAAFYWPLNAGAAEPPTSSIVRQLAGAGASAGLGDTVATVRHLAEENRFFHWHLEFPEVFGDPESGSTDTEGWPGGFSCVLGNPPWEGIELKEQEFFAWAAPEIASAAGAARKKLISALEIQDPRLWQSLARQRRVLAGFRKFLSSSTRYVLSSVGRLKTDPLFAELTASLTHPLGRSGLIVRTSILTEETSQAFAKEMVTSGTLFSLFDFENRTNGGQKYFEAVDGREKFCLMTRRGRHLPPGKSVLAFYVEDVADLKRSAVSLTANDIKILNPNTLTFPVFRGNRDKEISLRIYADKKVAIDRTNPAGNPWKLSFRQGLFNSTSASSKFYRESDLEDKSWSRSGNEYLPPDPSESHKQMLPLYEGKLVHIFEAAWATFQGGQLRELSPEERAQPTLDPLPRYWVSASEVQEALSQRPEQPFLAGFRKIARNNDDRTMIFFLHKIAGASDSVNLVWAQGRHRIALYASFSSFAYDYLLRQKFGGTNVLQFMIEQVPILSPDEFEDACKWDSSRSLGSWVEERALELYYSRHSMAEVARELGYHDSPFVWDLQRRRAIRAELDAAFFHAYGFARDEVEHVMDTFDVLARRELDEHGRFVTKERVLEVFDALRFAVDGDSPYQSKLMLGHGPATPNNLQGVSA